MTSLLPLWVPPLVTTLTGAVAYALVSYGSKRARPEGEEFEPRKFLRAVIIGLLVGLYAFSAGIDLSPAKIDNVAFSTGIVVIADQLSKLAWRLYQNATGESDPEAEAETDAG